MTSTVDGHQSHVPNSDAKRSNLTVNVLVGEVQIPSALATSNTERSNRNEPRRAEFIMVHLDEGESACSVTTVRPASTSYMLRDFELVADARKWYLVACLTCDETFWVFVPRDSFQLGLSCFKTDIGRLLD